MGTFFEVFLAGEDADHLNAVSTSVFAEISRLERLLSRFDPASEIARINREAGRRQVRIDAEIWDILCLCMEFRRRTGGAFDATAVSASRGEVAAEPFLLDEERRTVHFARPDAFLDLGSFGKGYALDRCGQILRRFRVSSGLLNGGTSSILAVGRHPNGQKWPIDVRDPFGPDSTVPIASLLLADQGFSCSAAFAPGQAHSDLIAPRRGEPLTEQAACVVVAPTALEAEVLSTACLVMGKEPAREYIGNSDRPGVFVGWIGAGGRPRLEWLKEPP
jgi:FAD:protein FMN transferase